VLGVATGVGAGDATGGFRRPDWAESEILRPRSAAVVISNFAIGFRW